MKIIEDLQISLSYFETKDEKSIFTIQLRKSPILFQFKQKPDSFDEFAINYTLYEPGYPMKISSEKLNNLENIYNINGGIDGEFKYWLNAVVKRYIQEKEMPEVDFRSTIIDKMMKVVIGAVTISIMASVIGILLLSSFPQNTGGAFATYVVVKQTSQVIQGESTELPLINNNPSIDTPEYSKTPEPPVVTAARVTTNGIIISSFFALIGSVFGAFAVIRAAKITSELKKKK